MQCLQLRHRHIIPRLAGCTAIAATALSPHAVRAAWRMNDGAILTIATNFDAAPAPIEPVEGERLFGPELDAAMLPGLTTCLWLAP